MVKDKEKQLSKPLEYFFCAAIVAFDFAFKNRKSQRHLALMSEHYIDFLSIIFWSMEKKEVVTHQMMTDDYLIQELRGVNWDKYSADVVEHYPQLLEKLAPKYAKIKKTIEAEDEEDEEDVEKEEN